MRTLALAGKPNAGKSTFFRAATRADVGVAEYPFTTIDANQGVTYARTRCPCLDRDTRCDSESCKEGKRYVAVELIDVAGLVPGAHEGRGLGNQFLDELMDAEAVLNVIDASGSTDAEGEPVDVGTYDPVEEADFIREELEAWLTGIITRNWETVERGSRAPDFDLEDALTDLLSGLGASSADIASCLRAVEYSDNPLDWTDADWGRLARELREQTKPMVLVANKVDIAPSENIDRLADVEEVVIPASAESELALRNGVEAGVIAYDPGDSEFTIVGDVSEEHRAGLAQIRDLLAEWDGTGVQQAINTAVYDCLEQITVYPVENETRWTDGSGNMLPDAFLLPQGATPRDLAYAVHSDIGDGYLHAVDARSGRRIGETHELDDGDVIKIVSTAA